MNLGIVVEGFSDSVVYPELIRKIRGDVGTINAKPCGDVIKLKSKFVAWLKHFEWHSGFSFDKALVIIDSDCSDAARLEGLLNQIYEQSHFAPSFPVHFHATKCELETWLLADEGAINQVSQNRGKNKRVRAATIQFESYRDAKELFQRVLSQAGLPADERVYQEIAAAANIGLIAERCPSFRQFANKVLDC
jgi:hypothetical protein